MNLMTLQDYKQRILRVLVHIQQKLDGPLTLEELARIASFSPYHFHRVFTGMLGESVQSHIRRLRLERAAMHLKLGNDSVTQLALEAGYESLEAFTRAFKMTFGVAPSRYRMLKRPTSSESHSGSRCVHFRKGKLKNFRTTRFGDANMKVTIQTIPARRVAFVRHVGPYSQCGDAWDRVCTFLGKEGLLGGDSLFIGVSHDDPAVTPPDKIRYDACVTVDDDFQPEGDIGVQTIAGGDYAMTTHFGPYQNLGQTYAKLLGQWLPRSGRVLASSPCFEVYFNNPKTTAPEDLVTDVCAPLAPQHC